MTLRTVVKAAMTEATVPADAGTSPPGPAVGLPPVWLLAAVQTVVAAASLVVEIVAGRMLAPYLGMSLYTWTSVIAVVLAGFSAGHWLGGRLAEQSHRKAGLLTA